MKVLTIKGVLELGDSASSASVVKQVISDLQINCQWEDSTPNVKTDSHESLQASYEPRQPQDQQSSLSQE